MFFSEEKNQKTFTSPWAAQYGNWPATWELRGHKSLLVLFFRKEHACLKQNATITVLGGCGHDGAMPERIARYEAEGGAVIFVRCLTAL
jgi:hypothetical protein